MMLITLAMLLVISDNPGPSLHACMKGYHYGKKKRQYLVTMFTNNSRCIDHGMVKNVLILMW